MNARERRQLQARLELTELIEEYGRARTAELLEVHRTTVERWLTGQVPVPVAVLIALKAAARSILPGQDTAAWAGWHFGRDGDLYGPDGRGYHPGNLLGLPYLHAQISAQRQQVEQLQAKIAQLERNLDLLHTAANDRSA
jgi:hypothetical protein